MTEATLLFDTVWVIKLLSVKNHLKHFYKVANAWPIHCGTTRLASRLVWHYNFQTSRISHDSLTTRHLKICLSMNLKQWMTKWMKPVSKATTTLHEARRKSYKTTSPCRRGFVHCNSQEGKQKIYKKYKFIIQKLDPGGMEQSWEDFFNPLIVSPRMIRKGNFRRTSS